MDHPEVLKKPFLTLHFIISHPQLIKSTDSEALTDTTFVFGSEGGVLL